MLYTGGGDEDDQAKTPEVVNPDPTLPGHDNAHDQELEIPGDAKVDDSQLG